jgi:putative transposase
VRYGYVESFNGRMRDELLNESLFFGLGHARSAISEWLDDLQHIPAVLVARIPDPGSLCRDYRRNRLQRCAR